MRWSSIHVVDAGPRALTSLLLVSLALQIAAGFGLAYFAGLSRVASVVSHPHWMWIPVMIGALAASFVGYFFAYEGVFSAAPGWVLQRGRLLVVALAGFNGFFAQGPTALDVGALQAGGARPRDAGVHVAAFGGLEYGVLALGGCGAAISVLVRGLPHPTADVTLPWSVLPLPGYLIAFWLAARFARRPDTRSSDGPVRRRLRTFLASIQVVRHLFAHPMRHGRALGGMALFWAGDIAAAWAGLALFGAQVDAAAFIVGFATGLVFTRRTGPLAGACVLALVLPVAIWYCGAPFAAAIVGIVVYQLCAVWISLPVSVMTRPVLRSVVGSAPTPSSRTRRAM